jgi:hypothetical protein
MNDLTLNILGFPAVNRDLTVELRDPATQRVVREVKPFLDGTVRVPKIDPGAYEVTVRHPNLTLPVLRRPIRVLPVGDTTVSVLIDPSQFRNTPVEDIPEANLTPVLDTAKSIAETVTPLANKLPGEAILAQDWNTMASAIRDLANTVAELTRLISPTGHDHPELIRKFDEVTSNFQGLLNSVSGALTELQRQIQSQRFRKQVEDVLDEAAIDRASPRGKEFLDLVDNLEKDVTAPPTVFGRSVRNAAVQLQTKVETLLDEKRDNPVFLESDAVKGIQTTVDLFKTQRSTTYDAELEHNRKLDRTLGGALRFTPRG